MEAGWTEGWTVRGGSGFLTWRRHAVEGNAGGVARLTLATGSLGNVRTRTMRAFTREETRKIISSLP